MTLPSPIWQARLDHIRLDSDDPQRLAAVYHEALGMAPVPLDDGTMLLQGQERRIVIGPGTPGAQPYSAFALGDAARLDRAARALAGRGLPLLPSPSPVFEDGAFAVADPDGRLVVFGVPRRALAAGRDADANAASHLSGRL